MECFGLLIHTTGLAQALQTSAKMDLFYHHPQIRFLNQIQNRPSQFHQGNFAHEQPINATKQVPNQSARLQLNVIYHVSFLA